MKLLFLFPSFQSHALFCSIVWVSLLTLNFSNTKIRGEGLSFLCLLKFFRVKCLFQFYLKYLKNVTAQAT